MLMLDISIEEITQDYVTIINTEETSDLPEEDLYEIVFSINGTRHSYDHVYLTRRGEKLIGFLPTFTGIHKHNPFKAVYQLFAECEDHSHLCAVTLSSTGDTITACCEREDVVKLTDTNNVYLRMVTEKETIDAKGRITNQQQFYGDELLVTFSITEITENKLNSI